MSSDRSHGSSDPDCDDHVNDADDKDDDDDEKECHDYEGASSMEMAMETMITTITMLNDDDDGKVDFFFRFAQSPGGHRRMEAE